MSLLGSATRPAWSGLLGLALELSLRALSGGDQRDSRAPRELPCFGDRTGPELPDESESVLFLGALASPKSWRPRGEGTRRVGWPARRGRQPRGDIKGCPCNSCAFPSIKGISCPLCFSARPAPRASLAYGSRGPEVCSHFPQERAGGRMYTREPRRRPHRGSMEAKYRAHLAAC